MAPPPPSTTTTSTCTVGEARGTHLFHVSSYRLHEGLGAGRSVRSAPFSVGCYNWAVLFYPDGDEKGEGCASMRIELLTKNTSARASCHFRLLNRATGELSSGWQVPLLDYRSGSTHESARIHTFKRKLLMYVHDDQLTIECAVAVILKPLVSATKAVSAIEEPPSDLSEHLERLLEEKEGSDVTFEVQGEAFAAHKIVLAMRSPVFKAKFYGSEREKSGDCIAIEDMQPAVFRTLLHYIYTDSLPQGMNDDVGDDSKQEMIRHLLVAADQYGVNRLKLMCEDVLCRSLSVGSVATTLAFADEHDLCILKDTCIEFITSSNKIDDVVASKGYAHLKRTCPLVLVEVLERSSKFCKV
uniref:BTB domain-containing protein n=1 Tax=Arundo donax TaxID=35708 RepID=A0A0A9EWD1_ARUDO